MSQNQYDALLERIRRHCQKVAQVVVGKEKPQPSTYEDNFDSYYSFDHRSFLALKATPPSPNSPFRQQQKSSFTRQKRHSAFYSHRCSGYSTLASPTVVLGQDMVSLGLSMDFRLRMAWETTLRMAISVPLMAALSSAWTRVQ